jgi:hypothetical protein
MSLISTLSIRYYMMIPMCWMLCPGWKHFLIHEFSHHSNIGSCRCVRLGDDGALALKTEHRDQLFYLYVAAARADGGRAIG